MPPASDWSFQLPATLEDNFQIDLRVTDMLGNQDALSSVWRGVIDTMAPRVTITATTNNDIDAATDGNRATTQPYLCTAEDRYLSEFDFTCPHGTGQQAVRTYNEDGNLGALFPGQAILRTMDMTNTVLAGERDAHRYRDGL